MSARWTASAVTLSAVVAAFVVSACKTESYCFDDCVGPQGGQAGTQAEGGASGVGAVAGDGGEAGSIGGFAGSIGGAPNCTQTNGGEEICDGLDNDCDSKIDEPAEGSSSGIDFTRGSTCGTCDNDCGKLYQGDACGIQILSCEPPSVVDSKIAGTYK